jgi:hypothetical protein
MFVDAPIAAHVIVAAGPPSSFQPITLPSLICMGAPIQLPIRAPTSKPTAMDVSKSCPLRSYNSASAKAEKTVALPK